METEEETGAAGGGEFVLPDAEDAPAGAAEGACDEGVAATVLAELVVPEGAVAGGALVTTGTAVPETTVDEDGKAVGGEDEVGFAEEEKVATPARERAFPGNAI